MLPANWRDVLSTCNFVEAREDLQRMLNLLREDARAQAAEPVFQTEFVKAWEHFAMTPSLDTAMPLIEMAPPLWRVFEMCCGGGPLARFP